MGFFDSVGKMFGMGASEASQQQSAVADFATLRTKYQAALDLVEQHGVQLTSLQANNGRLVVYGQAPSEDVKNTILQQFQSIEGGAGDLDAQFSVAQQAQDASTQEPAQTYTVKSGDTLSKISKHFYGDSDEFMRIVYANRDKISDPNKIQVGQEFIIPSAGQGNA